MLSCNRMRELHRCKSGFCISYEGDECVGEGVRADAGSRAFEIVAGKENLKLSLGRKGERVCTLTRLAGPFYTPS